MTSKHPNHKLDRISGRSLEDVLANAWSFHTDGATRFETRRAQLTAHFSDIVSAFILYNEIGKGGMMYVHSRGRQINMHFSELADCLSFLAQCDLVFQFNGPSKGPRTINRQSLENERADSFYIGTQASRAYTFDQLIERIKDDLYNGYKQPYGLVLIGGKSRRMGRNKAELAYIDQKPHGQYLFDLLAARLPNVYFSVAHDHSDPAPHVLKDRIAGIGPLAAICSAFMHASDRPWLVLACDLPYVDDPCLDHLLAQRDPSAYATACKHVDKDFADPLLTIWEPKAYPLVMQSILEGKTCPRKLLNAMAIKTVPLDSQPWVYNANTPEERQAALDTLRTPH